MLEGKDSEGTVQCKEFPVLWEKVIQQSIFLDISDDESVHFSDIQESFKMHVFQDSTPESSFHLCENIEPSHNDEDIEDVTSFLDIRKLGDTGGSKHNVRGMSLQRPDTMEKPAVQMCSEPGDTSDEDQEDLPYDGVLGVVSDNLTTDIQKGIFSEHYLRSSQCQGESAAQISIGNCELNNHCITEVPAVNTAGNDNNINEIQSLHLTEAHIVEDSTTNVGLGKSSGESIQSSGDIGAVIRKSRNEGLCCGITDLLLKHLSQEELFNSSKYIEAETLPEVSFIDSVEESVLTKGPCSLKHSKGDSSALENSAHAHSDSELSQAKRPPVTEGADLEESKGSQRRERVSVLDTAEGWGDIPELSCTNGTPDVTGSRDARIPLERTRSCGELKYGQGQVHYPIPDFSKVAPKVRIPKGNNALKPDSKASLMKPQTSLPGKCNRTTMEVISKVLEDEVQPSELPLFLSAQQKHNENQSKSPEHDQHLQVEYDKLLARYAEAENLIDQMRLGTKAPASSDALFPFQYAGLLDMEGPGKTADQPGLSSKHNCLPHAANSQDLKDGQLPGAPPKETDQLSEGEKMTTELKEIISQFREKVDEFNICLSSMSADISEQQMIFKSLMDAQDQLERRYIAKKEEHRAMQMQNYMGLAVNTGDFDPDREVEGEIFKLGMHLDNIKEQIDKNIRGHLFHPISPSSPTQLLAVDTVILLPSLPSEGQASRSSSSSPGLAKDNGLMVGEGFRTRGNPLNTGAHSMPQDTNQDHEHLGNLDLSTKRLEVTTSEKDKEEQGRMSHGPFHNGILPSSPVTTLQEGQKKVESLQSSLKSAPVPVCANIQENLSPVPDIKAVDSSQKTQQALQIRSSPETDSGVGGLDTSAPEAELLHTTSKFEQFKEHSASFIMSDCDSETSWSNVQTAVAHNALSGSTTGQWTCSIAGESATSLTGRTDKGSHSRNHEIHKATPLMAHGWPGSRTTAEAQSHNSHTCSCHSSEVIKALQNEVARLKEDFEQGLLCLPYIIKRVDYLISRYRQEKKHHRKSRAESKHNSIRAQHRHEVLMKTSSNHIQVEDWISSDMEPSRRASIEDLNVSLSTQQLQSKHNTYCRPQHYPDGQWRSQLKEHSFKAAQDPTVSSVSFKKGIHCSAQPTYQPFEEHPRSSYGLPASFNNTEQWTETHLRSRSVQSDSALLPYGSTFPKSDHPPLCTPRDQSQKQYRGKKGEDIRQTLDRAIGAAWNMKQTTDRMAMNLSADLVTAGLYRNTSPLSLQISQHVHTSNPHQHDSYADARHKYFTQGTV